MLGWAGRGAEAPMGAAHSGDKGDLVGLFLWGGGGGAKENQRVETLGSILQPLSLRVFVPQQLKAKGSQPR